MKGIPMSSQNRKWIFAFFFTLISLENTQARYECEEAFIETMPRIPGRTQSALHSIQRLNAGMMNRRTASEVPFSTQLWRETSSACTNGSLYTLRKKTITSKEFTPFALNIITQISGLKSRNDAYFYSFSEEGFQDQRTAKHQYHHFFFMRAAQIAQAPQQKQRTEDLAYRMSQIIYGDLVALSESLPLGLQYSAKDIQKSLIRFGYLFFTLLESDQKTIQLKVAAGPTHPSWVNEDRIAFICDQGDKRLAKLPTSSPLRRAYQQIKSAVRTPEKVSTLAESLQSFNNSHPDLEHILFLATPISDLPPQIDVAMDSVPARQLPTRITIKKGNVKVSQGSVDSYPALRFEQTSAEAILVFERFWIGDEAYVQVVRTLTDAVTSIYQTSGEPQFLLGPLEVQGGRRINIYAPYSQQFREFPSINGGCTLRCRKVYTENPAYPLRKPL